MRPIEIPAYMLADVQSADQQANAFALQQNWAAALGVYLDLARRYPHESSPYIAMLLLYVAAAEAQGRGVPRLALPEQAATSPTAEHVVRFEALQRRMVARLEELARRRGIRIRTRRNLRTGRYLRSTLLWMPWIGPPAYGVYFQTLFPSSVDAVSAAASGSRRRWVWPGQTFLLNQHLTWWHVDELGHLLSQYMLLRQHHRHRQAVLGPLVDAAIEAQSIELFRDAARRARAMLLPLDAMLSPEGLDHEASFRRILLVRLLRQELHSELVNG